MATNSATRNKRISGDRETLPLHAFVPMHERVRVVTDVVDRELVRFGNEARFVERFAIDAID